MVESALEEAGFKTTLCISGERAIESLARLNFRVLVTDVNLGANKLNGWDVAKHARETDANIGVIYMTGHAAEEWASHGVPNSVLITKPFAPAQLVTAVSNLFNTSN